MVVNEAFSLVDEFGDVGEGAAPDGGLGDDAEPSLGPVEPGSIGGGVVDVVSRAHCDPGFDLGVLVVA